MLKVSSVEMENTAWDKFITFTYEGNEYRALLHWDKWDGYDLVTFFDLNDIKKWIETPDWAVDWDEHNEQSLNYLLDELSDEKIEESYK